MVEGMAPGAMRPLVRPLTDHVGQPVNSCLAKGNHWVHFRRAAGWEIASQHGHRKQKQRHDQKYSRIMRANAIKQTRHHRGSGCGKDHAGDNSDASKRDPLASRTFQNIGPPCPQCHAESDLA